MAWKDRLRRGTFRGVPFHYEAIDRAGGRGTAVHNFPKANKHYTEDMGRRERNIALTVYVIGPTYMVQRDALIAALEADGPGQLILPTGGGGQYVANTYTSHETRHDGGMCTFDIEFIEAGAPAMAVPVADTGAQVSSIASKAVNAAVTAANTALNGGTLAQAGRAAISSVVGPL